MTKFSKKEMKKAGKTIRENIKKGKGFALSAATAASASAAFRLFSTSAALASASS